MFIPEIYYEVRNVISYANLFDCDDKYTLIGLAKFCKFVMSIFEK
jgi:hypothetical protein